MQQNTRRQHGFTLVELAIVLMIIGLLIGGILRGQELMNNARLGSIVKQVTSYSGAINTFRDSYSALPGDMPTATARLPGCANTTCQNGSGNGVIDVPHLVWTLGEQGQTSEAMQFWKHLALSHIISGVNPAVGAPLTFGVTHPASSVGGGFSIATSAQDPNDPRGSPFVGSLVLRLHGSLNGGAGTVIEDEPQVSPHQAAYIDRKMDDGMPGTGDVQATASGTGAVVNGGTQPDCEGTAANPNYNERSEFKLCTMAFLINR